MTEPMSWRKGVALAACVALSAATVALIGVAVHLHGVPDCSDRTALAAKARQEPESKTVECWKNGSDRKTVTTLLFWVGGVVAGLATLLAALFAAMGRYWRGFLVATALALVLSGLGLLVGSI